MSDICPTVTVLMDGKPVRINQSDYDAAPDTFTLASADDLDKPAADEPAAKPATPLMVTKEGKLFFAVTVEGVKVADVAGIDPAGYKTEAEAWAAIMALASAG